MIAVWQTFCVFQTFKQCVKVDKIFFQINLEGEQYLMMIYRGKT